MTTNNNLLLSNLKPSEQNRLKMELHSKLKKITGYSDEEVYKWVIGEWNTLTIEDIDHLVNVSMHTNK